MTSDHHILNVKEEDFPEKYRPLIRRLQRAIAEPDVRKTMDIEDEILEDLQNKEREMARMAQQIEEDRKMLDEKDRIIEELRKKLKNQ